MLDVPVDLGRLYYGDDPYYELFLSDVVDRVHVTRKQIAEEQDRKNRS